MKLIYFTLPIYLIAQSAVAQSVVHGYVKSNGTYVAPYVRSAPDSSTANNFGSTYKAGSEGVNINSAGSAAGGYGYGSAVKTTPQKKVNSYDSYGE